MRFRPLVVAQLLHQQEVAQGLRLRPHFVDSVQVVMQPVQRRAAVHRPLRNSVAESSLVCVLCFARFSSLTPVAGAGAAASSVGGGAAALPQRRHRSPTPAASPRVVRFAAQSSLL